MSNYLGISTLGLEKMISLGYTPDQIENKIKKGVKKEEQLMYDENSLYRYCIQNSYNYWVINYMIKTYGKTPEEAIKLYLENGQKFPTKWIYEKYDLLFKHLMLRFGLDSNRIIKIMKDNNIGIEKAIEELIFVSNNDLSGFKIAEINWLKELYPFIKELSESDLESAKKEFYISEKEMNFLKEKDSKIELIKRQLLLFEFSEVLTIWPMEELKEMMELYGITNEEKATIIVELYSPFKNKIINPTEEYINRQKKIRDYIYDESIIIEDLTEEEKNVIKIKKDLLSIMLSGNKIIEDKII